MTLDEVNKECDRKEAIGNTICIAMWAIAIILGLCLHSCKTVQPISTNTRNDSVKIEYRLDSVYLYERDSIYIDRYRSNDTIYLTKEKWLIRYKDKEVAVHDTIYRDREQIEVVQVKVTPKWAWWSLIACIALVAGIVIRIIIKIKTGR